MQASILLQSSLANYVTSPLGAWFPVVMLAAIAIIGVLAMIYMLGQFSGRRELAVWTKTKILEVLLSLILVFIFLFLISFLFSINFQDLYSMAGLLPSECQSSSLSYTDFFSIALCNMHTFNNDVLNFNQVLYLAGLRESLVPQVQINASAFLQAVSGIEHVGGKIKFEPGTAIEAMTGDALDALYSAFVLSQMQFLLLNASLLFFSLFMSLGLIARLFVITRSFGGAMIALAVGLGILYPLLVSFSYGFLNIQLDNNSLVLDTAALGAALPGLYLMAGLGVFLGSLPGVSTLVSPWLTAFFNYFGFVIVGLTIVPFMNFIVLDVFVIDFSSAIGERMDFMSLLTNVI